MAVSNKEGGVDLNSYNKGTPVSGDLRSVVDSALSALLPEGAKRAVIAYLEYRYKFLSRDEMVTLDIIEIALSNFFGAPSSLFMAEIVKRYVELLEVKRQQGTAASPAVLA